MTKKNKKDLKVKIKKALKVKVPKQPKVKKLSKKPKEEMTSKFQNDLDSFLKNSLALDVDKLSEFEQVPFWIHSGNYALNWIVSEDMFNGIPGTKAILISGEEAKGKSLMLDVLLGENIKAGGISYKVEVEDAGGEKFTSKIVGSNKVAEQIRIIAPDTQKAVNKAKGDVKKIKDTDLVITIEKLTSILNKLIDFQISAGDKRSKSVFVGIDSLSQLGSDKEIEDIQAEKDKKDMTPQQKMRALFRAINQKLKDANVTIIGLSHLTANIGQMFGPKMALSAKGSGWKFGNSLTINCLSSKEIKDGKTGVAVGVKMKLQTTKNRITFKGKYIFMSMYFNHGIDPYSGIGELLVQYGLATAGGKIAKEENGKNGKKNGKEKKSVKPKLDGGYDNSTVFTYKPLEGKPISWKGIGLWKQMNAMDGPERVALLTEWNNRLNEKYQEALNVMEKNMTDEESAKLLLESDDPDTEENEE